jgi:hypothetical protein
MANYRLTKKAERDLVAAPKPEKADLRQKAIIEQIGTIEP